jgi:methyl-accepting chemotaxis protein
MGWNESWNDLSIGKKLAAGFGIILALLVGVELWSVLGVGGIVSNAKEVISGNKLNAEIVQREVDHLNWVGKLVGYLTDDKVTSLDIQTDPHKCALGKWYYGEGRKEAETLVPKLASILVPLEKQHNKLHASAIDIEKKFVKMDSGLGAFFRDKKSDHLIWMGRFKEMLISKRIKKANVQLDHTKCGLGKWLYSPETGVLKNEHPEFGTMIDALYEPHEKLHRSGPRSTGSPPEATRTRLRGTSTTTRSDTQTRPSRAWTRP